MTVDVTPVLAKYLAPNRSPDPTNTYGTRPSEYGVSAAWESGVINLLLTFRCGSYYCCYERGCHLDLLTHQRWERLRRQLTDHGLDIPPRLKLRLEVVVEDGAIFFDYSKPDPTRRGRYAFAPVDSFRYQAELEEAESPG
jgi:hypothetical protein